MSKKKVTNKMKKSCLGKVSHKHRSGAEYVLEQMPPVKGLKIYKCEFCGLYHIGNTTSYGWNNSKKSKK
jgi:hypothetical protein